MTPAELGRLLGRIGELVGELEHVPDGPTREKVRLLLQTVLELHRGGIARLLELVADRVPAEELAGDEIVALLFSLHDLHPRGLAERVRAAVDELSAPLVAEGVAVDLLEVSEETVRVRVKAAGEVRATDAALRAAVESAIRRSAPEIVAVHIDGMEVSDVPLARVGIGSPRS